VISVSGIEGRMPEKAFTARGLTKTYRSGEVEVRALRGVARQLSAIERCRLENDFELCHSLI